MLLIRTLCSLCLTYLQTIVSDCSFVASLAIAAQYERRFNKKLITRSLFQFVLFLILMLLFVYRKCYNVETFRDFVTIELSLVSVTCLQSINLSS